MDAVAPLAAALEARLGIESDPSVVAALRAALGPIVT